MNLSEITTADLATIGNLLQRKETLQAEILRIDNQLNSYKAGKPLRQDGRSGSKKSGKSPAKTQKVASRKRSSRKQNGRIREGVDNVLKKAGKANLCKRLYFNKKKRQKKGDLLKKNLKNIKKRKKKGFNGVLLFHFFI